MIDKTAKIGKNVKIGEYVVIEQNVVVGDDVVIGHHVVIKQDTLIGNNVMIEDLVSLGRRPSSNKKMARKPSLELAPLVIGDHVKIGSNCVIYLGTTISKGVLIGDLASIRERVYVGKESIVGRNATVENNTSIGERVTIQTGAYVTADMIIEDNVFIGPCFSSSNDKYMGEGNYSHKGPILKRGSKIGNNATLLPGVIVGKEAIVGAGAVVTKDIKDNDIVVGNPAKQLK